MKNSKQLILVRHGHRDYTSRLEDNGLSEKGHRQAKEIANYYSNTFSQNHSGASTELFSSPKLRCVETLEPLAQNIGKPVEVNEALDEAHSHEDYQTFVKRIHLFFANWRQSDAELTIASSHGDWIPLALEALFDVRTDVKKGCWIEIELKKAEWDPEFVKIVQKPGDA